ncbi:FctA domain-containing protein [Streptococcus sp. IsoGale021]|uniref:Spy0128 family protein n=1 Tax=Streptococcus TaxID=1301 RepID=UPI0020011643|nr:MULTISPECIES: FctA domain-containing protein [Streptococcus]MCY7210480.1 Ig-like domain-containing protein [Streptococcus anginosus]MCY7211708.1 Ig-like domain-containing protein [Streptococcus anginosus]MCY7226787.1 Ig-like domain-containing protein [Streptococcus anginosus]MDQ8695172.1 FctA domain-containing protein [Streptococcus sp. IsoGale021]
MIKKMMNLVGVALLLASTILSPASAVAQTLTNQSSALTTQSETKKGLENSSREEETAKQTTPSTDSTGTNDSSNQEKKAEMPASENKTEASADSSQVKEDTASKKTDNVEEKNESKPGAPPALTPRSEGSKYDLSSAANAKEWNDVITEMYVTNKDGNPIPKKGVQMWETFQVHVKFSLPNNTVNEGDTTTITLPETLRFPEWTDFEVKDSKDKVVAHAKINPTTKTITLTYTKYPSEHSDVLGELFFYAAVDHNKVKIEKDIDLDFKVGHKTKIGGKLHYQGPGKKIESILEKSAWQDGANKSLLQYALAINRKGLDLKEVNVQDRLDDDAKGIQIDQSSIRIYEVRWSWKNGEWKHDNEKDVTTNHQIKMDDDKRGFQTHLGNIGTKGYYIRYQVKTNYEPVGGEVFKNKAKLSSKDKISEEVNISLVYRAAGGFAEGYVYSMNLHKEDEKTKQALAGAKFKVTRDSNKKVIGEYTTDPNGDITIPNLLKDDYTIEEVEAPKGYQKSTEKIRVKPTDFGTDKAYRKTITNKKDEKVSAQLQVEKELIGRQLRDKEFTFELKKQGEQTPIQTKSNDADGKVTFDALEFTEEGTYNYTISEKREDHPEKGIYYDPNDIQVTVKVSRNQEGKLTTEVTYKGKDDKGGLEDKKKFTNHYIPDKTKGNLLVKKELTGRKLQAGEFEFDLKENGQILQTVKNDADGKVQFKDIEYTKAGTYEYTISEKAGDVPGVEYEPNLISATVTVEDKGGKLEVTTVTYSKAGEETKKPTFENHYTPGKTFARLEVNKVLTGRQLQEDEFEFELTGKEDHIHQTKKNTAAGKVQFDTVEYTKAGEYHYTIKEKNNGIGGITYDSKEIKVTVKVTDDGKGKLNSEIFYENDDQTFKNTYSATKTNVQLSVKKALTGRKLKAQEFEFDLVDNTEVSPTVGKILQTVKNNANGEVNFKSLEYTKAGTYEYFIRENKGSAPGVIYDQKFITVTVEVKEKSGKLEVSKVIYMTDGEEIKKPTFNNRYTPVKTSAKLEVKKVLTGRPLQEGEFEFELKDLQRNKKILETVKNTADGKVQFKELKYTKAGTYHYTISEKVGDVPGVEYEPNLISATVTVEDKGGKLEVTKVTYSKAGKETKDPTFINQYTPGKTFARLEVNKILTGRQLQKDEFEFELKEDGKSDVLQTAKNDAQGKVQFQAINYDKAGEYHYTITEKNNGLTGVTYDSSKVKVTVKVTDDGKGKLSTTATYDGGKTTFKNTFTPKEITVPLQVTKALTGRNLQDAEFEFELYDGQNKLLETVKNKADGTIPFTALKFTKAGLYNYIIKEKDGKVPGVDYDKQPIKVTIRVQQEEDGQLIYNIVYLGFDESGKNKISKQSFTNKYTAKGTDTTFSVTKKLTGRALKDGEFSFDLKEDGKADVLQTKKNDKDGKVQFDAIKYQTVGTHKYTITEKNTGLGGVTYDTKTIKVTVEVTDNGKGQLVSKVTYENNDQTFTNTYSSQKVSAQLGVTKELTGRALNDQEFEFELVGSDDNVRQTKKNVADGRVTFDAIDYTKVGTYHYTIKEKDNGLGGVTYDKKEIKATVKVTDDGKGQLVAQVSYDTANPTFRNTYLAKETTAKLEANKVLTGRELKENEFAFDLIGPDGKVVETVKNAKDGKISFKELTFKIAGTYTYTIKEQAGTLGGVKYDTKVVKATVTVTDDGQGQLHATVAYENNQNTFTNTYSSDKVTATLSAKKLLEGRNLKEGEFEFELTGTDDQVRQTKTNAQDGSVTFDTLEYTKVGTYHYTITEKDTKLGGVTYDKKVIKATVTVTDDGQGRLVTKVAYEKDDQTFKNTYSAAKTNTQLSVKKALTGRALKDGEFEFELKGQDDKVVQSKKNAQDGSVTFDTIEYTKAGTYHYTITEKDTKLQGITYDKKVIKVTVEVTDDGNGQLHAKVSYDKDVKTFENRYTPPKKDLPKTGTVIHTLAIFIGIIALIGAVYLIKKKS